MSLPWPLLTPDEWRALVAKEAPPATTLSYRDKLRRLTGQDNSSIIDLGGPGSGNFGHAGRLGEVGGSGPAHGDGDDDDGVSARVLTGVDAAANAERETERHLAAHEALTGARPTPEALAAAEAELRALPLVHGTTVAGALGALEEGLLSYAAMQEQSDEFIADIEDLKDEIVNIVGDDVEPFSWEEVSEWSADDVENMGLERSDAKALVEKVAELQDIQKVLSGRTNPADAALDLDQFVFMTHGEKHADYGPVAVIIDNAVLQDGFATEHDIIQTPGITDPDLPKDYTPDGIAKYQSTIVTGDGYYQTAAAKAGSPTALAHRSRDQLFEVKVPTVPKSAVQGFVAYDYDDAVRLSDRLARKGLTGKVLYIEEPYHGTGAAQMQHQLKTLQRTGMWDEDAAATASDEGHTVHVLSGDDVAQWFGRYVTAHTERTDWPRKVHDA